MLQEKPSTLNGVHPVLSIFVGHFCLLDTDQGTPLHPDPVK